MLLYLKIQHWGKTKGNYFYSLHESIYTNDVHRNYTIVTNDYISIRKSFPHEIDLTAFTDAEYRRIPGNKIGELVCVLAYHSNHYVHFIKISDSEWIICDDYSCFICKQELLRGLFGGKDDNVNPLWRVYGRKWAAKCLIYKFG